MTMTTTLTRVAERIEADPDSYDQHSCRGARCCIAGHAALECGVPQTAAYGQAALGLEAWQAKWLFDGEWEPPAGHTVPEYLRELDSTDWRDVREAHAAGADLRAYRDLRRMGVDHADAIARLT